MRDSLINVWTRLQRERISNRQVSINEVHSLIMELPRTKNGFRKLRFRLLNNGYEVGGWNYPFGRKVIRNQRISDEEIYDKVEETVIKTAREMDEVRFSPAIEPHA